MCCGISFLSISWLKRNTALERYECSWLSNLHPSLHNIDKLYGLLSFQKEFETWHITSNCHEYYGFGECIFSRNEIQQSEERVSCLHMTSR